MSRLTCELCGSTDFLKQDGVFVCQSCGTKYSVEEAKKLMGVGTTSVSSTVSAKPTTASTNTAPIDNWLKRAFMLIADGEWSEAHDYCHKVLDYDTENAQAYIGMLMIDLRIKNQSDIKNCFSNYTQNNNFQKALRFGDESLKRTLNGYVEYYNTDIAPILQQLEPFEFEPLSGKTFKIKKLKHQYKNVQNFKIPNCVTIIGEEAFLLSENKTITIPSSVTVIESGAFRFSTITSLTIPNSVTRIGEGAFKGCKELTSVIIGTGISKISKCAFDSCYKLTSIKIPNSVKSIEHGAFWQCDSLVSITIPDSVTSIDTAAFWSCDELREISLPRSVVQLGDNAFAYCKNLRDVWIGNRSARNDQAFDRNQYGTPIPRIHYGVTSSTTSSSSSSSTSSSSTSSSSSSSAKSSSTSSSSTPKSTTPTTSSYGSSSTTYAYQRKSKKASVGWKVMYWIFIIGAIAVNIYFLHNAIKVPFYNSLEDRNVFSGWWSVLWPSWLACAGTLLLTGIFGGIVFKYMESFMPAMLLEVLAMLVYVIVLGCIFPPNDSIIENIIGNILMFVLGYIVPVLLGGSIGFAIGDSM